MLDDRFGHAADLAVALSYGRLGELSGHTLGKLRKGIETNN